LILKAPTITLIVCLSILASFPVTLSVPIAHGAVQNGPTNWSPFGPQETKMIITVYGDFQSMFNAFTQGQVDITDWPILPANRGSGSSAAYCDSAFNPDYFCTTPTGALNIFDLQINHYPSFLGLPLQAARTPQAPTVLLPPTTGTSTCSVGFGQLTIRLVNQEDQNATILDSLNRMTIANQPTSQPSSTVTDAGGSSPTGTYVFPCILAGTYKISSSIYGSDAPCSTTGPTSCLLIGSGQSISATFLVDWKSPSAKQPTQAGIYVPRALAHLLDKPAFVNGLFGASATYDDEMVTGGMGVPNLFSLTAECSDHQWFNPCNPISAYNLVSDNIASGSEWWTAFGAKIGVGPGYSGATDLRAACDDFVKAGFTVVNGANSTDCGDVGLASLGTIAPSNYPHLSNNGKNIVLFIRTILGRKQFGTILGDTLDFLFGTPSNAGGGTVSFGRPPMPFVQYYTINQLIYSSCFFDPTCWNLYTGGFVFGTTPDELYYLFQSSFASNVCGGQFQQSPDNYVSYCDPEFDTWVTNGEFSTTLSQSIPFFARAAATGATDGLNVPVFTDVNQIAVSNGWNFQQCTGSPCVNTQSSIVNTLGGGAFAGAAYWTLLNAHQVPGYNPCSVSNPPSNCGQYAPGGGDPSLIRRGFSQTVLNLSPFTATTPWESEIVTEIFDSMLQLNPLTGGGNGQLIDWQTTSHSSSYNPNEVSCNPANGCVTGTTTQIWHLKNDLFFQDGTPVTANDVAYTLLAYRDANSALFGYALSTVSSAAGLDCNSGQACKTLQVKLQQQSPFYELDIGTEPIIPEHIWEPLCGPIVNNSIPSGPTSQCANLSFDPMAQGIMIGDGPWQCVVPAGFPNAGHIGGPCTEDANNNLAGQSVDIGGRILLTRNDGFARCCPGDVTSSLYKISYADKNNDGVVNIQDLASAAFVFGKPDPYWVNSNIAPGTTVNIQDLATVAFYFGHGITYPYLPSQLTGVDPQIDPFFCPNTGC